MPIFKKTPRVKGMVSIQYNPQGWEVLTVNGREDPRLNGEFLARCGMNLARAFKALQAAGNCVSAVTERLVDEGYFDPANLARMTFERVDPFDRYDGWNGD